MRRRLAVVAMVLLAACGGGKEDGGRKDDHSHQTEVGDIRPMLLPRSECPESHMNVTLIPKGAPTPEPGTVVSEEETLRQWEAGGSLVYCDRLADGTEGHTE